VDLGSNQISHGWHAARSQQALRSCVAGGAGDGLREAHNLHAGGGVGHVDSGGGVATGGPDASAPLELPESAQSGDVPGGGEDAVGDDGVSAQMILPLVAQPAVGLESGVVGFLCEQVGQFCEKAKLPIDKTLNASIIVIGWSNEMKSTKNVRTIARKARKVEVEFVGERHWRVTSESDPNKRYDVWETAGDTYICDCAWGRHDGTNCKHILATIRSRMEVDGQTAYPQPSFEAAMRQRQMTGFTSGLWWTFRRAE